MSEPLHHHSGFENDFLSFIEKNKLFDKEQKLLLTISGGLDSMVMLDLMHRLGFSFGVAHANFQLRGKDSSADEELVKSTCKKLKIALHVKRFDTLVYTSKRKISVEMAARELRYQWFNELADKHGYQKILTAHHQNDQLETILLNLTRGSSISGLRGMKASSGCIVRPMLCFSRKMLEDYAAEFKIEYRHDVSNDDTLFQRNLIRHEVVPVLRKINPSLEKSVFENSLFLQQVEKIYTDFLEAEVKRISTGSGGGLKLDISLLRACKYKEMIISHLLKEQGVNREQVEALLDLMDSQAGKHLKAGNLIITRDRDYLIFDNCESEKIFHLLGQDDFGEIVLPAVSVFIEKLVPQENMDLTDPGILWLDDDKLTFPLVIRSWRSGDSFIPYGFRHKKKISDFLTDIKVPVSKRKMVLILETDGKIAGVLGYRSSDLFKVTPATRMIYKVTLINI